MIMPFPGKPPRFDQAYATYFLTFCTLSKRPILHHPGVPYFLINELEFYARHLDRLVAYTIMPDHLHLIVQVKTVGSMSAFLRDFKKYTSVVISKRIVEAGHQTRMQYFSPPSDLILASRISLPGSRSDDRPLRLTRIWQPGTMDHCIRMGCESKDYQNHLSYLFYNSKKHLGVAPKDFPYHNFMEFVREGYFDKSFCAINESPDKSFAIYE